MSLASRIASLVAVVIVAAGCGASGLPPAQPGASAQPAASTAVAMPAGTYTSSAFQPAVTYTVPDGWAVAADTADYFQLGPAGSEVLGVYLFRNAVALSQDPSCPIEPQPGVGETSVDLVTWMRGLPGLNVATPTLADVGGLRGTALEVSIRGEWTQSCSFANGTPTVPLIKGKTAGYRWIVAGSERLRLYVLDVPGSGNLIIDIDAFDGSQFAAFLPQATAVVKSMTFAGAK